MPDQKVTWRLSIDQRQAIADLTQVKIAYEKALEGKEISTKEFDEGIAKLKIFSEKQDQLIAQLARNLGLTEKEIQAQASALASETHEIQENTRALAANMTAREAFKGAISSQQEIAIRRGATNASQRGYTDEDTGEKQTRTKSEANSKIIAQSKREIETVLAEAPIALSGLTPKIRTANLKKLKEFERQQTAEITDEARTIRELAHAKTLALEELDDAKKEAVRELNKRIVSGQQNLPEAIYAKQLQEENDLRARHQKEIDAAKSLRSRQRAEQKRDADIDDLRLGYQKYRSPTQSQDNRRAYNEILSNFESQRSQILSTYQTTVADIKRPKSIAPAAGPSTADIERRMRLRNRAEEDQARRDREDAAKREKELEVKAEREKSEAFRAAEQLASGKRIGSPIPVPAPPVNTPETPVRQSTPSSAPPVATPTRSKGPLTDDQLFMTGRITREEYDRRKNVPKPIEVRNPPGPIPYVPPPIQRTPEPLSPSGDNDPLATSKGREAERKRLADEESARIAREVSEKERLIEEAKVHNEKETPKYVGIPASQEEILGPARERIKELRDQRDSINQSIESLKKTGTTATKKQAKFLEDTLKSITSEASQLQRYIASVKAGEPAYSPLQYPGKVVPVEDFKSQLVSKKVPPAPEPIITEADRLANDPFFLHEEDDYYRQKEKEAPLTAAERKEIYDRLQSGKTRNRVNSELAVGSQDLTIAETPGTKAYSGDDLAQRTVPFNRGLDTEEDVRRISAMRQDALIVKELEDTKSGNKPLEAPSQTPTMINPRTGEEIDLLGNRQKEAFPQTVLSETLNKNQELSALNEAVTQAKARLAVAERQIDRVRLEGGMSFRSQGSMTYSGTNIPIAGLESELRTDTPEFAEYNRGVQTAREDLEKAEALLIESVNADVKKAQTAMTTAQRLLTRAKNAVTHSSNESNLPSLIENVATRQSAFETASANFKEAKQNRNYVINPDQAAKDLQTQLLAEQAAIKEKNPNADLESKKLAQLEGVQKYLERGQRDQLGNMIPQETKEDANTTALIEKMKALQEEHMAKRDGDKVVSGEIGSIPLSTINTIEGGHGGATVGTNEKEIAFLEKEVGRIRNLIQKRKDENAPTQVMADRLAGLHANVAEAASNLSSASQEGKPTQKLQEILERTTVEARTEQEKYNYRLNGGDTTELTRKLEDLKGKLSAKKSENGANTVYNRISQGLVETISAYRSATTKEEVEHAQELSRSVFSKMDEVDYRVLDKDPMILKYADVASELERRSKIVDRSAEHRGVDPEKLRKHMRDVITPYVEKTHLESGYGDPQEAMTAFYNRMDEETTRSKGQDRENFDRTQTAPGSFTRDDGETVFTGLSNKEAEERERGIKKKDLTPIIESDKLTAERKRRLKANDDMRKLGQVIPYKDVMASIDSVKMKKLNRDWGDLSNIGVSETEAKEIESLQERLRLGNLKPDAQKSTQTRLSELQTKRKEGLRDKAQLEREIEELRDKTRQGSEESPEDYEKRRNSIGLADTESAKKLKEVQGTSSFKEFAATVSSQLEGNSPQQTLAMFQRHKAEVASSTHKDHELYGEFMEKYKDADKLSYANRRTLLDKFLQEKQREIDRANAGPNGTVLNPEWVKQNKTYEEELREFEKNRQKNPSFGVILDPANPESFEPSSSNHSPWGGAAGAVGNFGNSSAPNDGKTPYNRDNDKRTDLEIAQSNLEMARVRARASIKADAQIQGSVISDSEVSEFAELDPRVENAQAALNKIQANVDALKREANEAQKEIGQLNQQLEELAKNSTSVETSASTSSGEVPSPHPVAPLPKREHQIGDTLDENLGNGNSKYIILDQEEDSKNFHIKKEDGSGVIHSVPSGYIDRNFTNLTAESSPERQKESADSLKALLDAAGTSTSLVTPSKEDLDERKILEEQRIKEKLEAAKQRARDAASALTGGRYGLPPDPPGPPNPPGPPDPPRPRKPDVPKYIDPPEYEDLEWQRRRAAWTAHQIKRKPGEPNTWPGDKGLVNSEGLSMTEHVSFRTNQLTRRINDWSQDNEGNYNVPIEAKKRYMAEMRSLNQMILTDEKATDAQILKAKTDELNQELRILKIAKDEKRVSKSEYLSSLMDVQSRVISDKDLGGESGVANSRLVSEIKRTNEEIVRDSKSTNDKLIKDKTDEINEELRLIKRAYDERRSTAKEYNDSLRQVHEKVLADPELGGESGVLASRISSGIRATDSQIIADEGRNLRYQRKYGDDEGFRGSHISSRYISTGERYSNVGSSLMMGSMDLGMMVTAPITAGIVGSEKAAMDYQNAFVGVKQFVDMGKENPANIKKQLMELGTLEGTTTTAGKHLDGVPKSFEELSSIAAAGGNLGVEGKDIVEFTSVAAKLSEALKGLKAEDAATLLAKFAGARGEKLGSKNMEEYASVLAELDKHSPSMAKGTLEQAVRMAPQMTAQGMKGEDILAFASAAAGAGMRPQAASSSFNRLMGDIKGGAYLGKNTNLMSTLVGLKPEELKEQTSNDPAGVLAAFIDGIAKLGKEQRAKVFEALKIKGMNESILINALANQEKNPDQRVQKALSRARAERQLPGESDADFQKRSTLQKQYQIRMQAIEPKLEMVQTKIRNDMSEFGEGMIPAIEKSLPVIEALLKAIEKMGKGFSDLPQGIQLSILGFGGLLAALGPLAMAGAAVFTTVGAAYRFIGSGLKILDDKVVDRFTRATDRNTLSAGRSAIANEALAKSELDVAAGEKAIDAASGGGIGGGGIRAGATRTAVNEAEHVAEGAAKGGGRGFADLASEAAIDVGAISFAGKAKGLKDLESEAVKAPGILKRMGDAFKDTTLKTWSFGSKAAESAGAVEKAFPTFTKAGTAIAGLGTSIAETGGAWAAITAGAGSAGTSIAGLAAAGGPILLVTAAIAGLGLELKNLYDRWREMKDSQNQMENNLQHENKMEHDLANKDARGRLTIDMEGLAEQRQPVESRIRLLENLSRLKKESDKEKFVNDNKEEFEDHKIFPVGMFDPAEPKSEYTARPDQMKQWKAEAAGFDLRYKAMQVQMKTMDSGNANTGIPDHVERLKAIIGTASTELYNQCYKGIDNGLRHGIAEVDNPKYWTKLPNITNKTKLNQINGFNLPEGSVLRLAPGKGKGETNHVATVDYNKGVASIVEVLTTKQGKGLPGRGNERVLTDEIMSRITWAAVPTSANEIPLNQQGRYGGVFDGKGIHQRVGTPFPQLTPYMGLINQYSKKNNLDPALVEGLIMQESTGNPRSHSRAGASGLMQIMPGKPGVTNAFDPEQNIMAGTRELAQALKNHGGDVTLALKAYNAGEGNMHKYNNDPPFRETRQYPGKVQRYVNIAKGYRGDLPMDLSMLDKSGDVSKKTPQFAAQELADTAQNKINSISEQIDTQKAELQNSVITSPAERKNSIDKIKNLYKSIERAMNEKSLQEFNAAVATENATKDSDSDKVAKRKELSAKLTAAKTANKRSIDKQIADIDIQYSGSDRDKAIASNTLKGLKITDSIGDISNHIEDYTKRLNESRGTDSSWIEKLRIAYGARQGQEDNSADTTQQKALLEAAGDPTKIAIANSEHTNAYKANQRQYDLAMESLAKDQRQFAQAQLAAAIQELDAKESLLRTQMAISHNETEKANIAKQILTLQERVVGKQRSADLLSEDPLIAGFAENKASMAIQGLHLQGNEDESQSSARTNSSLSRVYRAQAENQDDPAKKYDLIAAAISREQNAVTATGSPEERAIFEANKEREMKSAYNAVQMHSTDLKMVSATLNKNPAGQKAALSIYQSDSSTKDNRELSDNGFNSVIRSVDDLKKQGVFENSDIVAAMNLLEENLSKAGLLTGEKLDQISKVATAAVMDSVKDREKDIDRLPKGRRSKAEADLEDKIRKMYSSSKTVDAKIVLEHVDDRRKNFAARTDYAGSMMDELTSGSADAGKRVVANLLNKSSRGAAFKDFWKDLESMGGQAVSNTVGSFIKNSLQGGVQSIFSKIGQSIAGNFKSINVGILAAAAGVANIMAQHGKKRTGSIIGGVLGGVAGFVLGGPAGAELGFGAGSMLGGMFDQPSNDRQAFATSPSVMKSGYDFGRISAEGLRSQLMASSLNTLGLHGNESFSNPAFMDSAMLGFEHGSNLTLPGAPMPMRISSPSRRSGIPASKTGLGSVRIEQNIYGDLKNEVNLEEANLSMGRNLEHVLRTSGPA